ncbi:SWAP (Suppressor-of-White-APricot)/surp domain-containing protein [Tasmannia lanceolata]|uniref:SWAP (Suppressor-of-White-APricot)/surp domain-containing protein n=1 Tax=Tasmannia lanceolata TaxID=3420 RepID=UPI004064A3FF
MDDEDFVFYGTPIEREEEMTNRKRKAAAEAAGQMRSLPPWKQEVRDDEGRRRFHGAFTGGFSAGFYNTVGSKEGWTPQTFTSSRKNRAEVKKQSVHNFLDDDEKAEMEGDALGTSLQFDTFGFTAAELARKQAEKELEKRPSAIPGPVPDEIVVPATNSIGLKLLVKMGWRHGHSIKDAHTHDARREARKAFLAFSSDGARSAVTEFGPTKSDTGNVSERPSDDDIYSSRTTPVFVLNPKQDLHGLGYDPFKHAPEFRERKRLFASGSKGSGNRKAVRGKENLFTSNSGKVAPGFGIGALEELDVEDEDIYAAGFDSVETYVEEDEEPSTMSKENKQLPGKKEHGVLSGFKVASSSEYQLERFDPPVIPLGFEPHHNFPAPLDIGNKFAVPPPPEVLPPEDNNLKMLIEGVATLVARSGKLFEDLSREKNKTNPLFSFLTGGNGHDFYVRKLWEEQQKRSDQRTVQIDLKSTPSVQKMTAESRGRILGERPLERSSKDSSSSVSSTDVVHLQFNLSDTFTKPASMVEFPEAAKPFKDDPAKQARFEQFLKDKYRGGLRSTYCGGSNNMSESDRARERLDFEAAAEAIEKGEWGKVLNPPNQQLMEFQAAGQFISGGIERPKTPQDQQNMGKKYPLREEYQWRPYPILCKRFDIIDPFLGKPPPLPRIRSRIDSLIFTADSVKTLKNEEAAAVNRDPLPVSQSESQGISEHITSKETEIESNIASVERPVDLYKAIFSDESDDEGEDSSFNQVDVAEKKSDGANTTLNRLIAGDFLESLGKELGLEVPPEPQNLMDKTNTSYLLKETSITGDTKISSQNDKSTSTLKTPNGLLQDNEDTVCKLSYSEVTQEGTSVKTREKVLGRTVASVDGSRPDSDNTPNSSLNMFSGIKPTADDNSKHKALLVKMERKVADGKRTRTHSRRQKSRSNTSDSDSDDDHGYRDRPRASDRRTRKNSRRNRSRSSTSDGDFSDDHGYRDRSRSKEEKRDLSRRKSRKHSKHNDSRSKESPSRSPCHGPGREYTEQRHEKSKSRNREKDSVSSKFKRH